MRSNCTGLLSAFNDFQYGTAATAYNSVDINSLSSRTGVFSITGSSSTAYTTFQINTTNKTVGTAFMAFDAEYLSFNWTPYSLSGLGLWLDATNTGSIIQSGGNVTEWRDLSGNNRHFAHPTTARQPVFESAGFNGKPCINTADSRGLYRNANTMGTLASSTTLTVFTVVETQAVGGSIVWNIAVANWHDAAQTSAPITRIHYSFSESTTYTHTLYANNVKVAGVGSTAGDTKYVGGFVYAGANQTSLLSLNGAISTFVSAQTMPSSLASSTSVFYVGDARTDLKYGVKRIAEVIMYDRVLTDMERMQLEQYLKIKYSIP
jgi:hypothetical protein